MNKEQIDVLLDFPIEILTKGFIYQPELDQFKCLICGECFENDSIYQVNDKLYTAKKALQLHMEQQHISMFNFLIDLDKEYTGLSEQQKNIFVLFHKGYSDFEISETLGGITQSTIRSYRASFRKREKQAKIFLALTELSKQERAQKVSKDSQNTRSKNIKTRKLPKKMKDKIDMLEELVKHFEFDKKYTEKEVNEIIKQYFDDYVAARRYLVEYQFLGRKDDGTLYWKMEVSTMKNPNRKELIEQYKEMVIPMGVYQIRNSKNGKVFIASTTNLRAKKNSIFFMLKMGNFIIEPVQNDFNEYGEQHFDYEILEELEIPKDNDFFDHKKALSDLEEKWIEQIQPFGEKGYNKNKSKK